MAELSTFIVIYRYVPEMESRRTPHREEHLAWLRGLAEQGLILLAGALQDPVDSAVLVVRAQDPYGARILLVDDPYAKANLITGVTVRPIGLAVGG